MVELDATELALLAAPYRGVTIDVGAGDGRYAYASARRHPERLVIGMDPVREGLRETSSRALRKQSRGGLPNVLYVWAGIEQPPDELSGVADEVHVVLPWGKLLRGVVLPETDVLAGLRRVAAPEALLRLVLGVDVWADPVPVEVRGVPEPTLEYVERHLARAYAREGLRLLEARALSPAEIEELPSTWARRLAHGRPHPQFVSLRVLVAGQGCLEP